LIFNGQRKSIEKNKDKHREKQKLKTRQFSLNSSQRTPVDGRIFTPLPHPTRSATHMGVDGGRHGAGVLVQDDQASPKCGGIQHAT
jgi:hypothetical protein